MSIWKCVRGQSTVQSLKSYVPAESPLCPFLLDEKTERGKKQSHRDVIKMQQQILLHKTSFLRSPLTLPASFQVFFFSCSRSSSCSPSLPFKLTPIFFLFYEIITLLVITAGLWTLTTCLWLNMLLASGPPDTIHNYQTELWKIY